MSAQPTLFTVGRSPAAAISRRASGLVALLCGAALALGAANATADTVVDRTARPTDLSAGEGVLVYSRYDTAIRRYRLMLAPVDGRPVAVPVAPSRAPFDADVGATAKGNAYLVYQRCGAAADSCDVYTFNTVTRRERRSAVSDPHHAERHVTYWKGRLVFVREYGTRARPHQVVYERPSPRSRRSERLPGLPSRRCVRGRCQDVSGGFDDLELNGELLAQAAYSTRPELYDGQDGKLTPADLTELRLVNVRTGRSQQLSRRASGLGGQTWLGLSFDGGLLHAYFACLGESDGCKPANAGAYRYGYSTRRWQQSGSAEQLGGYAVGNGTTYAEPVNAAGGCGRVDPIDPEPADGGRCPILRRQPSPSYVTIDRP